MSYTYAKRKQAEVASPKTETVETQGPSPEALRSGAAIPSPEQMGHRVDLPDAMRTKMENAFGADLSAVKLYESQAVADVGSQAITQGADIAFAPGLLDFSSFGGQALLGHELSHVVSQARGEVTGGGFLQDASLEARADREGAMAAAGEPVYMPTASLSPVSAADAAGPMQAKLKPKEQSGGDTAAAVRPPAHLPPEALQIPISAPVPAAQLPPMPAYAPPRPPAPAQAPVAAAGAEAAAPRPASASGWNFGSHNSAPSQLSSANAVRFVLGGKNADSKKHGQEFRAMMSSLETLTALKQSGDGESGAVREAMVGNANRGALKGMMEYRKKLKSEWGDREDRHRQMDALDSMISAAQADQAASEASQTATLTGSEFTRDIRSGQLNQVYRYARGGSGGYFKPKQDTSSPDEQAVMDRTGITYQDANGGRIDPRLANREIAYYRLGALLGSEVALGAKSATLGEGTPSGESFGGKTFNPAEGSGGVLQEEAKGKEWDRYNWRYWRVAPSEGLSDDDEGFYQMPSSTKGDLIPETPAQRVLTGFHTLDAKGEVVDPSKVGTNVGSRRKKEGFALAQESTDSEPFSFFRADFQPEKAFDDRGPELDISDPDYQRQMNQMFLIDTLASYTDRHQKNFLVDRSESGRISVRAIDNDLSFGSFGKDPTTGQDLDEARFGKRGEAKNYGGMPAQMQIDAGMAEKIQKMDKKTLELTFSDLLNPEEIESLWTRFQMMKKYIGAMRDVDPKLIVGEWNEDTAKRELDMAGGGEAARLEDKQQAGGYAGNNYYQEQLLRLNYYRNKSMRSKSI